MDEARQLGRYLNDAQGDFRQTVGHLNRTVAALAEASGGLQRLLAQTGSRIDATSARAQTALDSADALINEARITLKTVDGSAQKIDAALPGIAMKLDQSLDSIREASAAAIGLMTNEIVTLVSDSGDLLAGTREVMGDVKRSWPLREMVEKPQERMLKLDSGGGLLAVPVEPARAP
jgi:ABC-type transporter Mla subunit MlaD